jgi:SOUL heme-binding protein
MTPQISAQAHRSFDLTGNVPSGNDTEPEAHIPIRRFWKTVAAAFLKRFARMLPTDRRILQWSKETDETIIASLGPVQIRHVPGGCLAQTSVKGDMNPARGTALLRLVRYVSGDNQRAARLNAERPLLQQRRAPGLWQIAIRLVAVNDVQGAPVPRARKIKIVAQEPATWAVVTWHGRPTEQAMERAERAIMDTIARSQWFAAGSATVRIHAPASILPFAGSFEVAVPVYSQAKNLSTGHSSQARGAGREPTNRPANPPGRPVH